MGLGAGEGRGFLLLLLLICYYILFYQIFLGGGDCFCNYSCYFTREKGADVGTHKGEVVNHIICIGSEMSSSLVSPLDCGDDSDYFASDLQNHVIAVISSDCLFLFAALPHSIFMCTCTCR